MKIWTILLLSLGFAAPTVAEEIKIKDFRKNFEKKIDDPKLGQIRIKYKYAGEPQAKPADVTIFLKCNGAKKETQIYYDDICQLNKYEYSGKILTFQLQKARVDETSKVWCDQYLDESLKLEEICAKASAAQ